MQIILRRLASKDKNATCAIGMPEPVGSPAVLHLQGK